MYDEQEDDKPFTRALQMLERRNATTPQRQYQAPERESAPERNDWRMLLAMGLNLIGNKGRDLGQIALASEDQYNRQLEAWRQRNSPDAMLDRDAKVLALRQGEQKLASAPVKDAQELASTLQAQDNAEEAVRQFNTADERARTFHTDDITQQELARALSADQFNRQLTSTDANARAARGLQWAGLKQAGEHYAAQDRLARDQMSQQEAMAARAAEQQRALAELQQSGLNTRNSADIAARSAIEQQKAAREAERQLSTESRQFNLDTAMPQRMAGQLERISRVTDKYGANGDIPGVGTYDSSSVGNFFANVGAALGTERGLDAKELNNARATLADLAQRDVSGAGGAEAEALRIQMQSGAQPGATEAEFRTGIAAAQQYVKMVLSAQATGREEAASNVMRSSGLGQQWLGGGGQNRSIDPSAYSDIPTLRRR